MDANTSWRPVIVEPKLSRVAEIRQQLIAKDFAVRVGMSLEGMESQIFVESFVAATPEYINRELIILFEQAIAGNQCTARRIRKGWQ